MPVPKFLQPVLWSKDVRNVDVRKDRDYIVHQVLSRGTMRQVRWLEKEYGKAAIRRVFLSRPSRSYSPSALNFSSKFLIGCPRVSSKKYVQAAPLAPLHLKKRLSGLPALFDSRDLASNKAYAIGRRGTWRDYADMHAWLDAGGTLASVIGDAERRFDGAFSARLFLEQLVYTKDLGPFAVDFLDGHQMTKSRIEKDLAAAVESYLSKAN